MHVSLFGALPDVGVDVADTVTDIGTTLGAVVLAVVGVYAAFLVVRFGMRWLKRTGG